MTGYQWRPIEDLPNDWHELASSELAGLFGVWKERAVKLKDSPAYQQFQLELRREWAIETGIIEGLYDIDRGVTRTLIQRGLHTSYITHEGANKPAEEIVPILRDHENVIDGLFDFVGQQRQLSTSYIKLVHQLITAHQKTVVGIDQFGNNAEISLLHGDWKKLPNNPTRPDGKIHEFCPPEQTASEMDRLIEMHLQHLKKGIPPEVEAAWLHHRFTQIHPFQDGNGRVARALASVVFIRAGWFPIIVHRDDREHYIDCLERADGGYLTPLVVLFGRIQKKAFNQVFNVSQVALPSTDSVEQIIATAGQILKEKEENERLLQEEWRKRHSSYKQVAMTLFQVTDERLEQVVSSFKRTIDQFEIKQQLRIAKDSYGFASMRMVSYDRDCEKIAAEMNCNPELKGDGWGVSVDINAVHIYFCFYAVKNSDYQLACGLAYLRRNDSPEPFPLSSEVFQCAVTENIESVIARYKNWMEEALILGFEEWRKSL